MKKGRSEAEDPAVVLQTIIEPRTRSKIIIFILRNGPGAKPKKKGCSTHH